VPRLYSTRGTQIPFFTTTPASIMSLDKTRRKPGSREARGLSLTAEPPGRGCSRNTTGARQFWPIFAEKLAGCGRRPEWVFDHSAVLRGERRKVAGPPGHRAPSTSRGLNRLFIRRLSDLSHRRAHGLGIGPSASPGIGPQGRGLDRIPYCLRD